MNRKKHKNLLSSERQNKMNVKSRHQLSSAVEALFLEAVAKQKAKSEAEAEAAEVIDKVKAQVEAIAKVSAEDEEKTRAYIDTITKVKAEAEEKAGTYTHTTAKVKPSTRVGALFLEAVAKQKAKSEAEAAEAIAEVRAEAEEKARTYTDTIARVKTEAEEAIAKVKAEAKEVIAKVKAEEKAAMMDESKEQPIYETIQKETTSPAYERMINSCRMFYSLQEAAEKLNKTKEELKEIVKQGKLREFRVGSNVLFKADEVEALASEGDITKAPKAEPTKEPALKAPDIEPSSAGFLSKPAVGGPELESQQPETIETAQQRWVPIKNPPLAGPQEQPIDLEALDLETPAPEVPTVEPEVLAPEPSSAGFLSKPAVGGPAVETPRPEETAATRPQITSTPPFKTGLRIEETVYRHRLSVWQWFLKGLREDDALAVIVLCLLLCIVFSTFVTSGYFVYTIFRSFP